MAKSPNALHTQNALLAERKIIPLRDAGKGLEHIYAPKGHVLKIRLMTPLEMKNHPRSQLAPKLHLQVNHLLERTIQKTDFATTPNKRPNVDTAVCHI